MALRTEIPARGDVAPYGAVAVHVVRRTDGDRLALLDPSARMTRHTSVRVLVDLIALNLVRNGRRLHRKCACTPDVLVLLVLQRRRRRLLVERRAAAHRVHHALSEAQALRQ